MILDTLANAGKYSTVHPLFPKAFEYLTIHQSYDSGTFEIIGKNLYVIVSRTEGEAQKEPKLEVHRKYIDIQVALDGSFDIGWKPLAECMKPSKTYDADNDYALFDDPPDIWATIPSGTFGIFFPEDAHAPQTSPNRLVKAVFKVAVL